MSSPHLAQKPYSPLDDPLERGIDAVELELAAALGRGRHLLGLQRVHARQAADPGLVELDRPGVVVMVRRQLLELLPARIETGLHILEVGRAVAWSSI